MLAEVMEEREVGIGRDFGGLAALEECDCMVSCGAEI